MQDLSSKFQTGLSPSSMNAGNTTADSAKLVMTAPGSTSVLPVPDRMDVLPMPQWSDGGQIPVSHPGNREKVTADTSAHGGGRFDDVDEAAGLWKAAG